MKDAAGYQQRSKTLNVLSIAGVALTLGIAGCRAITKRQKRLLMQKARPLPQKDKISNC